MCLSAEEVSISLKTQKNADGRIYGFVTCINIPDSLPKKYHSILKNVVKHCTVKKTIMNGPEFVVETVTVPATDTSPKTEQLTA